jgi:hypothetical protein
VGRERDILLAGTRGNGFDFAGISARKNGEVISLVFWTNKSIRRQLCYCITCSIIQSRPVTRRTRSMCMIHSQWPLASGADVGMSGMSDSDLDLHGLLHHSLSAAECRMQTVR